MGFHKQYALGDKKIFSLRGQKRIEILPNLVDRIIEVTIHNIPIVCPR